LSDLRGLGKKKKKGKVHPKRKKKSSRQRPITQSGCCLTSESCYTDKKVDSCCCSVHAFRCCTCVIPCGLVWPCRTPWGCSGRFLCECLRTEDPSPCCTFGDSHWNHNGFRNLVCACGNRECTFTLCCLWEVCGPAYCSQCCACQTREKFERTRGK
jgi:hypothetical protein